MVYTCDSCIVRECSKREKGGLPENCPMRDEELFSSIFAEYSKEENKEFYITSSEIEALGYSLWPRLREIMEFAKKMGYSHLGLAFCRGLSKEAKVTANILRDNGFTVSSVICKTGGKDKSEMGIQCKVHENQFESMCNPIAQAKFLEKANTDFNITLGLCVGHDSLFYKYSHTFATAFAVKDRALAHNPLGAVYISESPYMKNKLEASDGEA